MRNLCQFTGLYPVSKTLRFELIPVGNTAKSIQEHGIIEADTRRAKSYQQMKKTLDEYHRQFIENCLSTVHLTHLDDYFKMYTASPDEKAQKDFRKKFIDLQQSLRSEIADSFMEKDANGKKVSRLPGVGDLIKKYLESWIAENQLDLPFDESFRNFTTYFSGYEENRNNMYVADAKATAVSYRLINENLPTFINNLLAFRKIADSPVADCFSSVMEDMSAYINFVSLADMFALPAFNWTLTQSGIDAYNTVIGGIKDESSHRFGLNNYINQYNQGHPKDKLPKLKPLYKQILSDRVSASWLPEVFENAEEMLNALAGFCASARDQSLYSNLMDAVGMISSGSAEKIFVRNDASISSISNAVFGYYGLIRDALEHYYIHVLNPDYEKKLARASSEKARMKLEEGVAAFVTKKDYHSLADIEAALKSYIITLDLDEHPDYQKGLCDGCVTGWLTSRKEELISDIDEKAAAAAELMNVSRGEEYRLSQTDKNQIKELLDAVLELLHTVRPLYVKPDADLEKDPVFYGTFDPLYEELQKFTKLYDKVRNFCTQKPYSTEKVKLTFNTNNGNLMNGWVDSKTEKSDNGTQYGGYLFRKKNGIEEYDYYLGISANTKLFRAFREVDASSQSKFERLDYYQPKEQTIYGSAYKGKKTYAEDKAELLASILRFAEESCIPEFIDAVHGYCVQDSATPTGCLKLIAQLYPAAYDDLLVDSRFAAKNSEVIANLKATIASMVRLGNTDEIIEKEYMLFTAIMEDISEVAKAKKFNYFHVSQEELDQAMEDAAKPLFLFKISNKDLSFADTYLEGKRKSRGKDNLHTMYFKALMGGGQSVYDIGTAEVFFRKASLPCKVTHPANQPIASKNPAARGQGKKNVFAYDLVKDKHYAFDKFQLHLSMAANYSAGKVKKNDFNEAVCTYLKNNPDVNIIGIDRGERHLLYISMIDRSGNVVRDRDGRFIQYSLNTITGSYKDSSGQEVAFATPYHTLLDEKEKARQEARENWGIIENIKELKAGYLSQVVHHIAKLMVEYNAIVVLEDLNSGFKNGRKKIEKQVYQNFERALIQKLNYLVFKDADPEAPGGLYHAYQLADQFKSFRELTKQTGFIFYVPAWNTSKIDPVTGFVDLLKPKYTNIADAQRFFGKFERISYNAEKEYFEFAFDYSKFTEKAVGTKTCWTVCTHGSLRYTYNRSLNNNRGGYEKVNVTAKLRGLFAEYGIDYTAGNLISAITAQNAAPFFVRLIKLLQVTLAMRYSCAEDGMDFILSPVMDENGQFFSSEDAKKNGLALPHDADANGAYHIARKGIMVLDQIDRAEAYRDWTTKISNRDWLRFVQKCDGE